MKGLLGHAADLHPETAFIIIIIIGTRGKVSSNRDRLTVVTRD